MDFEPWEEIEDILNLFNSQIEFDNITIKQDNRIAGFGRCHLLKRQIQLNLKKLNNVHVLRLTLLHELGHFLHNPNTDNILKEYIAHKFAIRSLNIYFPDTYEYAVNKLRETIEDKDFRTKYPNHYKGYLLLYNEI